MLADKEKCCGCGACREICPHAAIVMQEDAKGFRYPVILEDKCVKCGLCQIVCNMDIGYRENQRTILAKLKDGERLAQSQSGGAFVALSDLIFHMGGVCYGAGMDEKFEAVHKRADNGKERDGMRGSKYVQSKLEGIYRLVEKDLKDKRVLFSGTPCQVGGLLKYLTAKKVDMRNLYTVDLICHGVSSVKIWRDLINYNEKKYGKIEKVVFQSDAHLRGMARPHFNFLCKNKLISDIYHRNIFYTNLALRDSCYHCEYANMERVGDFTIGDAWGAEEKEPEFFDARGVSLILFNSEKAMGLLPNIRESMHWKEVNLSDFRQANMEAPSKPHRDTDEFWRDYHSKPFAFMLEKYAKNNFLLNWRYILMKLGRLFQ